jgi:Sec-independent protein translocase protein TatA
MFGIGLPELLIIGVLILLFVNPKDMPSLFRRIGKTVNEMRKMREHFLETLRESDLGEEGLQGSHPAERTAEKDDSIALKGADR